jgi:hypothetical protein
MALGRWEQTQPVEIALVKGQNVLRFTRPAPSRGLTIKDFTLTPAKYQKGENKKQKIETEYATHYRIGDHKQKETE